MTTNERYRIDIDFDPDEYDDARDALRAFARDASVTFTDVTLPTVRDRAFGEYVDFTATPDDLRRYAAFYDFDPDESVETLD